MARNTFLESKSLVEQARVHPELIYNRKYSSYSLHVPTADLESVASAGRLLRLHPNIKLTDAPLNIDNGLGTPARTLLSIINQTVSPPDASKVDSFKGTSEGIDCCSYAEEGFIGAFEVLEADKYENDSGAYGDDVRIITGRFGRPVLIQKSDGEPSAISLRPININGITYPTGSIVNVELRGRTTNRYPDTGITKLSSKEVVGLCFMRLSLFALSPKERDEYFAQSPNTYYLAETYKSVRMERIARIAGKAAIKLTITSWLASKFSWLKSDKGYATY